MGGSSRRQRSTSATRRRAERRRQCSTADDIEEETTIHGLSSVFIWILATSSLIVVITPPSTNTFQLSSYDPITTREKFILDNIETASKMYTQNEDSRNFAEVNQQQQDYNYMPKGFLFNRPRGLRWRDDQRAMQYFGAVGPQQQQPVEMMPILTENPSASHFGRGPSTSNHMSSASSRFDSPSLEDLDLIDCLWRNDMAEEKGTRLVEPADQYVSDLQTLTEKSTRMPLNTVENKHYENMAMKMYEEFPWQNLQKQQQGEHEDSKSPIPEQQFPQEHLVDDLPTDKDLADLLDDVSREEGQLNLLFDSKNPVLNNVSLSDGLVYTHANMTEMQEMQESCNQIDISTIPTTSSSQPDTLFNITDSQTNQQWSQSEVGPSDVFPQSNYAYIGMHNDTLQAIVSNGQVDYDHAYQAAAQSPLSPLIIGGSSNSGRQQQTQTSPGSVTVTATATQSLFDPYHSQRHSFSDCTTDSSSTCSRLSSESPRYNSESSTGSHETRFYGKLVPARGSRFERPSSPRSPHSSVKIGRVVPLSNGQRKRGRQSKDEQLASEHALPVSAHQISEMSLSELQQVLKNESLSEYQRQLIRKIRRRGKNKVAARTCRQRRTDRHDKVTNMNHYC